MDKPESKFGAIFKTIGKTAIRSSRTLSAVDTAVTLASKPKGTGETRLGNLGKSIQNYALDKSNTLRTAYDLADLLKTSSGKPTDETSTNSTSTSTSKKSSTIAYLQGSNQYTKSLKSIEKTLKQILVKVSDQDKIFRRILRAGEDSADASRKTLELDEVSRNDNSGRAGTNLLPHGIPGNGIGDGRNQDDKSPFSLKKLIPNAAKLLLAGAPAILTLGKFLFDIIKAPIKKLGGLIADGVEALGRDAKVVYSKITGTIEKKIGEKLMAEAAARLVTIKVEEATAAKMLADRTASMAAKAKIEAEATELLSKTGKPLVGTANAVRRHALERVAMKKAEEAAAAKLAATAADEAANVALKAAVANQLIPTAVKTAVAETVLKSIPIIGDAFMGYIESDGSIPKGITAAVGSFLGRVGGAAIGAPAGPVGVVAAETGGSILGASSAAAAYDEAISRWNGRVNESQAIKNGVSAQKQEETMGFGSDGRSYENLHRYNFSDMVTPKPVASSVPVIINNAPVTNNIGGATNINNGGNVVSGGGGFLSLMQPQLMYNLPSLVY